MQVVAVVAHTKIHRAVLVVLVAEELVVEVLWALLMVEQQGVQLLAAVAVGVVMMVAAVVRAAQVDQV
jgi:hypothetical protein